MPDCPNPGDLLILGVGNPTMGDDGVGSRVVELLSQVRLPPNVQVKEAGTPGWGLASWLDGWSSVILVDAVDMGAEPGMWRRFCVEDIQMLTTEGAFSLHESDLASGLALADALEMLPEKLVIYGIQPENLEPGTHLSSIVDKNLIKMVTAINTEARNYSAELNNRSDLDRTHSGRKIIA